MQEEWRFQQDTKFKSEIKRNQDDSHLADYEMSSTMTPNVESKSPAGMSKNMPSGGKIMIENPAIQNYSTTASTVAERNQDYKDKENTKSLSKDTSQLATSNTSPLVMASTGALESPMNSEGTPPPAASKPVELATTKACEMNQNEANVIASLAAAHGVTDSQHKARPLQHLDEELSPTDNRPSENNLSTHNPNCQIVSEGQASVSLPSPPCSVATTAPLHLITEDDDNNNNNKYFKEGNVVSEVDMHFDERISHNSSHSLSTSNSNSSNSLKSIDDGMVDNGKNNVLRRSNKADGLEPAGQFARPPTDEDEEAGEEEDNNSDENKQDDGFDFDESEEDEDEADSKVRDNERTLFSAQRDSSLEKDIHQITVVTSATNKATSGSSIARFGYKSKMDDFDEVGDELDIDDDDKKRQDSTQTMDFNTWDSPAKKFPPKVTGSLASGRRSGLGALRYDPVPTDSIVGF